MNICDVYSRSCEVRFNHAITMLRSLSWLGGGGVGEQGCVVLLLFYCG